jgi:hypothetical protein
MGCKGLHCDGCNHGSGGPAAAVIALLVIVAVAAREVWPKVVHAVEIAAWTVAGLTGAAILATGTVLTVRVVRRVRARRALRQAARQVHAAYHATVIPAVRLTDRSAIDRAGWPGLGQPPQWQPKTWPLAGWREDEYPWTGGDGDEHRPR